MQCGKLVVGQCPEAMRDRYFLYPVPDSERPHLGYNLGQLITKKKSEGKFCLSYFKRSRTVNQTGRQHLSLVFTASCPQSKAKLTSMPTMSPDNIMEPLCRRNVSQSRLWRYVSLQIGRSHLENLFFFFADVQLISVTKQQEYLTYLIIKVY